MANELQQADADTAVLDRLRELMAECGPTTNKSDLAITLIKACIGEGLDTGPAVVRTLKALGFSGRHVGITLATLRGSSPERHHWQRHQDGRYSLHPDEAQR